MNKVFKYPVPVNDYFFLDIPRGAKILTVQVQNGEPQIWALVNPENPIKTRNFCLAGTGDSINERNLIHIGTFQIRSLVWHLFEIKE